MDTYLNYFHKITATPVLVLLLFHLHPQWGKIAEVHWKVLLLKGFWFWNRIILFWFLIESSFNAKKSAPQNFPVLGSLYHCIAIRWKMRKLWENTNYLLAIAISFCSFHLSLDSSPGYFCKEYYMPKSSLCSSIRSASDYRTNWKCQAENRSLL